MNNSAENPFCAQSFQGLWKINHKDFPSEYWGMFSYDPRKGEHKLTIYGVCNCSNNSYIPTITGVTTTGEIISILGINIIACGLKTWGEIGQSTTFSFQSFCIGNELVTSENSIRLRKYSFRCSNLESWSKYRPFQHALVYKRSMKLGKINTPQKISLYEDDLVRVILNSAIAWKMSYTHMEGSYEQKITIEAKGNRKLPYYGSKGSFSYYENVIYSFFAFAIGKHAMQYQRYGILRNRILSLPAEMKKKFTRKQLSQSSHISFFDAQKIEEKCLKEIDSGHMMLPQCKVEPSELTQIIHNFFDHYSEFGFVLKDWIAMRNQSSYTNYSLPEILYNLEGLHRSLYPECDESNGYKNTIKAIHAISPFVQFDKIIGNKNHTLPFRQRLQDILFIKVAPYVDFLKLQQKNDIIEKLVNIRNDAAHCNAFSTPEYNSFFLRLFLCEYLVAILIFVRIGLSEKKIKDILSNNWEWNDLKQQLMTSFGEADNA